VSMQSTLKAPCSCREAHGAPSCRHAQLGQRVAVYVPRNDAGLQGLQLNEILANFANNSHSRGRPIHREAASRNLPTPSAGRMHMLGITSRDDAER
jgi:hypothetical protein